MAHTYNPFSLIIGIALGLVILHTSLTSEVSDKNFAELALDEETTVKFAEFLNTPIHCKDLTDIEKCVDAYHAADRRPPVALWLGNSQLHAINQAKPEDQPAAYFLHPTLREDNYYLIAMSQPNANLIEHYALFNYLLPRLPVETLILPIVFDDMRNEGLRSTLKSILWDDQSLGLLQQAEYGSRLVSRRGVDAPQPDNLALSGTVQQSVEHYLGSELGKIWELWKERPALRGELIGNLYAFRNWALQINPSTIRRKIPGRYQMNLGALRATVALARQEGVKVILYIPPLRNDYARPYDPLEYETFKLDIQAFETVNVTVADLELLVPNQYWGTKGSTTLGGGAELDFMHFQARGHELLAEGISEIVKGSAAKSRP